MHYVHTNMRVRDSDASLRFYEALGYEPRRRFQFDGAYNVYLGLPGDGDTLELTVNEGRDEPYDLGGGYGHIALAVDDLDALLHLRLPHRRGRSQAGGAGVGPWHRRAAGIQQPSGKSR